VEVQFQSTSVDHLEGTCVNKQSTGLLRAG
jgi:hypothetical protein